MVKLPTGIDPRLVVRTDPKPNITNFEPNYLAIIDYLPAAFTKQRTCIHDMIAKTRVVRVSK
jgi:hypothetical protein